MRVSNNSTLIRTEFIAIGQKYFYSFFFSRHFFSRLLLLRSALPFPHQSWPFPKRHSPNSSLSSLLLFFILFPLLFRSHSQRVSRRTPRALPGSCLRGGAAPRRGSSRVLEPYEEAKLLVRERDLGGGGSGAEELAVEDSIVEDESLDEVGGIASAAVPAVVELGNAGRDLGHLKIAVRVLLSGERDESVQEMQFFKSYEEGRMRALGGSGSEAENVGCGSSSGAGGGRGIVWDAGPWRRR
ncbi:uncharacterized protein LOC109728677 [Ananas comosus]|uniref:Uncharacterized protein LOC109728677 n=1 Tax=Ananas comosus TaxID=4615 RepID=A0A6P5HLF3_ANACO|nr:uncharacterized protein LOC109728677 [Ananas comosus]